MSPRSSSIRLPGVSPLSSPPTPLTIYTPLTTPSSLLPVHSRAAATGKRCTGDHGSTLDGWGWGGMRWEGVYVGRVLCVRSDGLIYPRCSSPSSCSLTPFPWRRGGVVGSSSSSSSSGGRAAVCGVRGIWDQDQAPAGGPSLTRRPHGVNHTARAGRRPWPPPANHRAHPRPAAVCRPPDDGPHAHLPPSAPGPVRPQPQVALIWGLVAGKKSLMA